MGKPAAHLDLRRTRSQLVRYGLVGLASNGIGYLLYLLVTNLGATPKLSMSLLYGVGATIGFFGNRSLTFSFSGKIGAPALRYVVAHAWGYLINFGILAVFVDRLGHPHQIVQGVAILVVAAFLFIAFKFHVFRS